MRTATAVLTASLLLAVPAVAGAATPTGATGATGATGPAPAPAPARATLTLRTERVGAARRTVLAGSRWRVRGTLTPYVAGQRVVVRFSRGGTRLAKRTLTLRASRSGRTGGFLLSFRTRGAGRVTVRAAHAASGALAALRARSTSVDVLPRRAGPGSPRSAVRALQQRLAALGYVVGRRGAFDARTGRAVTAYRKVTGMARTTTADASLFRRLARGQGAFKVRYPRHGRHVEADISRQVLALVGAKGKVERIYTTSSGTGGTPTILGSFKVYRKDLGTNAKGMVDSSYFIRGYAIHGYASVPTYNASHGCLRVPIPDALSIFRWIRYGTRVDTYR